MVKNKLAEPEVQQRGWLLDGYPRSGEQAEAIEREGIRPDVFLLINVRAALYTFVCLFFSIEGEGRGSLFRSAWCSRSERGGSGGAPCPPPALPLL